MQTANTTETREELASRIIDTALFVLQTRQLTNRQQQTLVSFLQDTVDLEIERVQEVVQRELHPKFRNVLSFEERWPLRAPFSIAITYDCSNRSQKVKQKRFVKNMQRTGLLKVCLILWGPMDRTCAWL